MKRCRHAAEGVVDKAANKIKHFPFGPVGAAFAASDAEGSAGFAKWKEKHDESALDSQFYERRRTAVCRYLRGSINPWYTAIQNASIGHNYHQR